MKYNSRDVLAALRTVLPAGDRYGHHDASVGMHEFDAIKDCFGSNPTGYAHVEAFEEQLRRATGAKHVFATNTGTAALHLALVAAGVQRNDAVIIPSLTFIGTAAAVMMAGAVPVLVDVSDADFGIMAHKLGVFLASQVKDGKIEGRKVSAVIPVHLLGRPCDMGSIVSTVTEHLGAVPIIEDAAEALGSTYCGMPCGSIGTAGILSFNNNKIVTTGGGGAVVTNDEALAKRVRHLGTTARVPHRFLVGHDGIGFNYRLSNIAAAVGFAQMERLDIILKAKRALAHAYQAALRPLAGITFVGEVENGVSNNWLNAIMVSPNWRGGRDELLSLLWDNGIGCREIFQPLHSMPAFQHALRHDPRMATHNHNRVICLPSGVDLAMRYL